MRRHVIEILRERPHAPVVMSEDANVRDAAKLMRREGVGSVLVMHGDRLAGIFTERDALNRVIAEERDPGRTELAAVMTRAPKVIAPDRMGLEALRMMEDGGFRHLPVMENGRVLGVISRRDFLGPERTELEDERCYWEHI